MFSEGEPDQPPVGRGFPARPARPPGQLPPAPARLDSPADAWSARVGGGDGRDGALLGGELSRNLTPGEAAGPWPGLLILLKWKQFLPVNLPEFSVESHFGFASWRI